MNKLVLVEPRYSYLIVNVQDLHDIFSSSFQGKLYATNLNNAFIHGHAEGIIVVPCFAYVASCTKAHTWKGVHQILQLPIFLYGLEILETGRCNRWPASTSTLTLHIQINIWKGKHILQAVAVTPTPHMPSLKYSTYSPVSFWIYLITYAITWRIARVSDSFEPSYFTQKRVILWTIRLHGSPIVLDPFS